jgi:hypothetical protein
MTTAPPLMQVNSTFPRDPRLYVRDHQTFLRETLRDAAAEHHTRHIPWHFEKFAAAKYGYQRRSSKYQARKDKLGLPPLVSPNPQTTGQLKTAMTQFREITATSTRSRLIMRLPFQGGTGRLKVIGGKLSTSQQNVLARIAEMEAIADDERAHLAEFVGVDYARRANLPGVPYRTRMRTSKV